MNTDIIVCGTGIVGLAAAVALARRGVSVGLLGPAVAPAPARIHEYAQRVYAISPASRDFLETIGVWRALPGARIAAMRAMEVYGDGDGFVQLHAWQAAQDALGWIVEATEIERALVQEFGHSSGALGVGDAGERVSIGLPQAPGVVQALVEGFAL